MYKHTFVKKNIHKRNYPAKFYIDTTYLFLNKIDRCTFCFKSLHKPIILSLDPDKR